MKKLISLVLALVLAASLLVACSSGSASKSLTIAVPNDTTNEARALLLLEANGLIKLKDNAGLTATIQTVRVLPLPNWILSKILTISQLKKLRLLSFRLC